MYGSDGPGPTAVCVSFFPFFGGAFGVLLGSFLGSFLLGFQRFWGDFGGALGGFPVTKEIPFWGLRKAQWVEMILVFLGVVLLVLEVVLVVLVVAVVEGKLLFAPGCSNYGRIAYSGATQ